MLICGRSLHLSTSLAISMMMMMISKELFQFKYACYIPKFNFLAVTYVDNLRVFPMLSNYVVIDGMKCELPRYIALQIVFL